MVDCLMDNDDIPMVEPEELDELDRALARAFERGRLWVKRFQAKTTDEQAEVIAEMIWHEMSRGVSEQPRKAKRASTVPERSWLLPLHRA